MELQISEIGFPHSGKAAGLRLRGQPHQGTTDLRLNHFPPFSLARALEVGTYQNADFVTGSGRAAYLAIKIVQNQAPGSSSSQVDRCPRLLLLLLQPRWQLLTVFDLILILLISLI